MKKTILLDSSSGLTEKEANKLGFYFTPLIINLDGKEYKSGVDINNEFLLKNMSTKTKLQTSTAKLGDVEKKIDDALKKYDQILVITISKHLSSMNSMIKIVASERKDKDKIFIYDSSFLTPWTHSLVPELKKLIDDNSVDMKTIIEKLDFYQDKMMAYLVPDSLEYLYSGGRITKAQYLAGNFLKVFPIIVVKNGRLDAEDVIKKRTIGKTFDKVVEIVSEEDKNYKKMGYKTIIKVVNINSNNNFKILKDKLVEAGLTNIEETTLSSEILVHIGPRATGLGVFVVNNK